MYMESLPGSVSKGGLFQRVAAVLDLPKPWADSVRAGPAHFWVTLSAMLSLLNWPFIAVGYKTRNVPASSTGTERGEASRGPSRCSVLAPDSDLTELGRFCFFMACPWAECLTRLQRSYHQLLAHQKAFKSQTPISKELSRLERDPTSLGAELII